MAQQGSKSTITSQAATPQYPLRLRPASRPAPGPKLLRSFPIPKEDNSYSRAKRYEYVEKNLDKAEQCYLECIELGIRVESALKDLASLWHQRGRTLEACDLLEKHQHTVHDDVEKYTNLLENLREKVENRNPRYLLLTDLPVDITEPEIRDMFTHPQRIMEVEIIRDMNSARSRLKCMSISAAKKTIGGFLRRKELHLDLEDMGDKHTEASDSEGEEGKAERSETDLLGSELVAALNEVA